MPPTIQQDVERYESLTPREHVLLRTGVYAGDCVTKDAERYVLGDDGRMGARTLRANDGLLKLFQEAFDNAVDNTFRDPPTTIIRVRMNERTFECMNNGAHIPVQQRDGEWIPTAICFKMFSGSNFNDDDGREAAGVNGVGIKLAAILSKRFEVDCVDPIALLHYKQVSVNNMATVEAPVVKPIRKRDLKKNHLTTHVLFEPDLTRFPGIESLNDMVPMVKTRLVQLSCTLGGKVKFFFNEEPIKINTFKRYIELFPMEKTFYEQVNDKFEYGFGLSDTGVFQNQSFANNLATVDGGTHTNIVTLQICDALASHLESKHKKSSSAKLSRNAIKNKLMVFVNVRLTNPEFRSQAKTTLTNRLSKKDFPIDTKRVLKVAKQCGLLEALLESLMKREIDALQSMSGKKQRKVSIPKLDDAHNAGTIRSKDCILYLTEGDSASTMVRSGMSVIGRKNVGCFPLRGKVLNVVGASSRQIAGNAEVQNILKIVGLSFSRKYETEADLATLRYGRIAILADQDSDGFHIAGLLLSFVHHWWPALVAKGFLYRFVTPLVKATHKRSKTVHSFYDMHAYETWAHSNDVARHTIKYYKGLGTSTRAESIAMFSDLDTHLKRCVLDDGTAPMLTINNNAHYLVAHIHELPLEVIRAFPDESPCLRS